MLWVHGLSRSWPVLEVSSCPSRPGMDVWQGQVKFICTNAVLMAVYTHGPLQHVRR